jgi:hypothetical protein
MPRQESANHSYVGLTITGCWYSYILDFAAGLAFRALGCTLLFVLLLQLDLDCHSNLHITRKMAYY